MKQLKLMMRNRENIWKKYEEDHQWMAYIIAHNKYISALKRIKIKFMNMLIVLHHGNSKISI